MKSTTIKRIVAFLFLTVGILYIVMWLDRSRQIEGFQSYNCPIQRIGGQDTYLCKSVNDANVMLAAMTTPVPICYDDSEDTGINGTYVCYDTNGEPTFDSSRGVYVPFNPITDNDPMPQNAQQDIITGNRSFLAGYNSFMRAYNNAVTMENNVSTLGLVNIKEVQANLNQLSAAKCQNPTATYTAPCNAINRALTTVNNIVSDTSISSLTNLNTTLTNTRNTMKSSIYNEFLPGFYTNVPLFMSSPQIANYLANK